MYVTDKINSIREQSILFSTSDINVVLDSLKSEKSCGVDGLTAEHFMFVHRITHVFYLCYLTLLLFMVIYLLTLCGLQWFQLLKIKQGTPVTRINIDLLYLLLQHPRWDKYPCRFINKVN